MKRHIICTVNLCTYKSVKEEGHTWLENIKYLLFTNGYGNI